MVHFLLSLTVSDPDFISYKDQIVPFGNELRSVSNGTLLHLGHNGLEDYKVFLGL